MNNFHGYVNVAIYMEAVSANIYEKSYNKKVRQRHMKIVELIRVTVKGRTNDYYQTHDDGVSNAWKKSIVKVKDGKKTLILTWQVLTCSGRSSHMIKLNKSTVVNVRSAIISRFCVGPTSKRRFLKIVQVTHGTWSVWCHVGIHVNFTSIFHSHTPLVPQA